MIGYVSFFRSVVFHKIAAWILSQYSEFKILFVVDLRKIFRSIDVGEGYAVVFTAALVHVFLTAVEIVIRTIHSQIVHLYQMESADYEACTQNKPQNQGQGLGPDVFISLGFSDIIHCDSPSCSRDPRLPLHILVPKD